MSQYPVFAFGVINDDREESGTLLSIKPLSEQELRDIYELPEVKAQMASRELCFDVSATVEVAEGSESVDLAPPSSDQHEHKLKAPEKPASLWTKHHLKNLGEIPKERLEQLQGSQGFRPLHVGEPREINVARGKAQAFLIRAHTQNEKRAVVTRFVHTTLAGEKIGEITVMMLPTHDPFQCG